MHLNRFTLLVLGLVAGIYLLFGFYTIASDQMGVVTMFGKVTDGRVPPGIHYRLPWPFTSVQKPQVAAIRRMSIGFKLAEQMQGMRPSREERERLTGNSNVINIGLMVQYTVCDPAQYLFATEGPDFLLRKAGEALLCEKVGRFPVDDMLTVGKSEVEQYVRSGLQAFVDNFYAGILIRSCNLQKVEPPAEVIESFNEVSRAKANREKVINEAHSYQSELLPRARAEAQQITQTAEARARERVRQAAGEVERFEKLLTEYRLNPEVLKQRLFWNTLQEVLTQAHKVLVDDDRQGGTTVRIIVNQP